jgi:hypothetical protein
MIDYEFMSGWLPWVRWVAVWPAGYVALVALNLLHRAVAFVLPESATVARMALALLFAGVGSAIFILSGVAAAPKAKWISAWVLVGVLVLEFAGSVAVAQSWGLMTEDLWRAELPYAVAALIGIGAALAIVYRAGAARADIVPLA